MPRLRLAAFLAGLVALLAGCAQEVRAPDAEVMRASYSDPGQTYLTLYTVINNSSGSGAHTGLLINGSQRVIWDPAGTFYHPHAPEQGDVIHGVTDDVLDVYIDYHARKTYRVVEQKLPVSAEVAEAALRAVKAHGAAAKSTCSITTSQILSSLPGWEDFPRSWYPRATMRAFAARGASERVIYDEDADNNAGVLIRASRKSVFDEPEAQASR